MTCQKDALELKKFYSNNAYELNRKTKLSFKEKVKLSSEIIKKALKQNKKPVVSSSFGKDSMVLIHLVHKIDSSVPVVVNLTGQMFPETIKYMEKMENKYNLHLIKLKPRTTYWELVRKHGYPNRTRETKSGAIREPKCCIELKTKPMEKFRKNYKYDLNFVGLTGNEGRHRRLPYIMKGSAYYLMRTKKIMKCIPLIWWKNNNIWEYHDKNNIPHNPVYEKYGIERTGCMACTGFLNWEKSMQKVSFPLYKKVMHDKGQLLIEDYKTKEHTGAKQ